MMTIGARADVAAEMLDRGQAIHAGEPHIEDHQIGRLTAGGFNPCSADEAMATSMAQAVRPAGPSPSRSSVRRQQLAIALSSAFQTLGAVS